MPKITLLGQVIKVNGNMAIQIDNAADILELMGFHESENVYITIQSVNDGTKN